MLIFPAIDLYEGQAVRLFKGDYNQKTVYSDDPVSVAKKFKAAGAEWVHLVDLEGAKSGETPNFDLIKEIKSKSSLCAEVGGGIRSIETVEKYITAGIDRVILGTAAVKDQQFLRAAVEKYGKKIAVGIDIKDGRVAVHGWTETTEKDAFEFFGEMQKIGVSTVICTDISRDGAMRGTNLELYRELSNRFSMDIIASGGVSTMDDVTELAKMDIYGAIIGKAYYTGAIDLEKAVEAAK